MVSQIKEKLIGDKNLIINILESLGCHKISSNYSDQIRAALPDGETETSLQVLLDEHLTCNIYSRSEYKGGDLIELVSYLRSTKFTKSLEWICGKIGVEYKRSLAIKNESEFYKFLKLYSKKNISVDIDRINLSDDILKRFTPMVIENWVDEGISEDTQLKYGICVDKKSNRILIPIRDELGNLVSIKGRTLNEDYKELKIPKFIHYYKIGSNDILYGLNYNKDEIRNSNELIIFEAEKSVMMCDSFEIYNAVSVGTNSINPHQVKKILNLKCNVTLAFDKDVSLADIKLEADKLRRFTNVYAIYDRNNLLKNKQSPVDDGFLLFDKLYKERIKI